MSERAMRRLVVALLMSLVVATGAAGLLTLSSVRAGLSPVVVMTLATIIGLWPLATQAVFVVMQGMHRQVLPRIWNVNDGWLLMLVLSVFPTAFNDQLVDLVHPAIQGLTSPPALASRLALFLLAGRAISMRLSRWERSKRAESSPRGP